MNKSVMLRKNLSILIFFLIVIFFSGCDKLNYKSESDKNIPDDSLSESINETGDTITIIGVGDIMMGSNYPVNSLPPDDGKDIFTNVKDILSGADITFGNLEGPLLTKGGTPKICGPGSHCVAFRMPEHYAGYLADAGFDIVSIANNHANDMGKEGRKSTRETLDKYKIGYAGQTDSPVYIFECRGIKFGLTAFSPSVNTCNINDIDKATEIVGNLSREVDIVIVSFHGGGEGASFQHVTGKREFFLGENRGNVYEFAHILINAGADIILGHGPHVPRAIEIYRNKFIAYSLGNFCTYAKFGLYSVLGVAPIIKISVDKNGDFLAGEIIPAKQVRRGIPVPDEDKTAVKLIKRLTKEDFPESNVIIDDDGKITLDE